MRILYFDIDSLRPDHLGCYGYSRPTSPTIDRIAAQGMRFERYYCATSPCVPSRTCLVTGRHGIRTGVVSNHGAGADLRLNVRHYGGPQPDNQLFPRVLMEHGLDTICFSTFPSRHFATWFFYGWTEFHTPAATGGTESAEQINARLLPWLQRNADRDDYFLYINYWDVHRPYFMDPQWAERFADHPVPQAWPDEQAIAAHQSVTGPYSPHGQFSDDLSPYPLMPGAIRDRADFEQMVTGYDAAIAYTDHHIAQVLAELERQGHLDDTVVIISADHGDSFGEHGIYSDHVNVDESVHHIPMIIRWPGVTPPGGVCDALMSNVDFAPTLCDLLGITPPSKWDGQSYRANVAGEPGVDRPYLVWDSGLYAVQRALRTRTHLYIRTYDDYGYGNWQDEELYHIAADPYQTRNLATHQPALLRDCRERMERWVADQLRRDPDGVDPLLRVLDERRDAARQRQAILELLDFPEYHADPELIARIEHLRADARRDWEMYLSPVDRSAEVSDAHLLDTILKLDCYNHQQDGVGADYAWVLLEERLRLAGLDARPEIHRRLREAHARLLTELRQAAPARPAPARPDSCQEPAAIHVGI